MKKVNLGVLLSICLLIAGCAFAWDKQLTVGAKGAKTKIYGELESGQMVYNSEIFIGFLWCER